MNFIIKLLWGIKLSFINGIKRRMELTDLFRFTRRLRGDTAELFADKYGIGCETLKEWEFGIGVTACAEKIMCDYVSSDIECLMAFVEQFKVTHRAVISMLKSFANNSDMRFIERRKFQESMEMFKQFYRLLNEYEKKYILRGYDLYISFESNQSTTDLIFSDDKTKCKEVVAKYQLIFIRAKSDINNLLSLYGVSDIITSSDVEEIDKYN